MSFFDTPLETISWAHAAIRELEATCHAFFHDKPIRRVIEHDSESGDNIVKFKQFTPLPSDIARRTMEALAHIRNSFDQSLFAACCSIGKLPRESIYFPWSASPADLEHRLRGNKNAVEPKIAKELWPILCSFEPYPRGNTYPGGDNHIRELAKIANRKHTVRVTFAMHIRHHIIQEAMSGPGAIFNPFSRWDSMKNEAVLARFKPGSKFDYHGKIAVEVVFDEAVPLRNIPILDGLRFFLKKAESVTKGLQRETAAINGS